MSRNQPSASVIEDGIHGRVEGRFEHDASQVGVGCGNFKRKVGAQVPTVKDDGTGGNMTGSS
jgi:hypothetical protein